MPIRPINEILGRHLAVWYYSLSEETNMPNYDAETLKESNVIAKLQKEWDINALPDWLKSYTETRDKITNEHDNGRESKIYPADILIMYNRTKRELLAMEKIEELEIKATDLGMEEWQLDGYLMGTFILEEARTNALMIAYELDNKEDFLYFFAKFYDVQKGPRSGNFHPVPSGWQKSITIPQWRSGKLDQLLGKNAQPVKSSVEELEEVAEQPVVKSPVEELSSKSSDEELPKRGRPKTGITKKTVGAVIPCGLKDAVTSDARDKGMSVSALVEELIRRRMK